MKLTRRIAAVGLALAMVVSSVPASDVRAQVSYDPINEEKGYHGIYIDTDSVPQDDNIELTTDSGQQLIRARTNVCFQLDCNVDSSWEVKADTPAEVTAGDVTISDNGFVAIKPNAKAGYYTITAMPQNVETVRNSTIRLYVRGTEDPAKVEKVLLNKELMDSEQMEVSEDRMTLTVDGTVTKEPLYVTVEPDYLYEVVEEGAISFENRNDQVYDLTSTGNRLLTTKQKSTGVSFRCIVGNTVDENQDFTLVVKEQDFTKKLVCEEKIEPGSNNTYDISMDRIVHYDINTNAASSLPHHNIKTLQWTLSQNEKALTPETASVVINGITYRDYKVFGSDGDEKVCVAHIYLSDSVAAIDRNASVIVKTETFTSQQLAKDYKVDVLELAGNGTTDDDNAVNIATARFRISTTQSSAFSDIRLDFDKAGLVEDVDYAVKKETFGGKERNVYYFEADGSNLDLSEATFVDVDGVASFEQAREKAFSGDDVSYTVQYIFEDFEAFGSPAANERYNNSGLLAAEFGSQSNLRDNTTLTKQGIGYKKLTVKCTSGTADPKTAEYIIRFVSSASTLSEDGLTVSQNSSRYYNLNKETVHIRQGEAVVPEISDKQVTILDPYMDYEFSVDDVANRIIAKNGDYRINGLNPGKVRVTAVGTVNKTYQDSFYLYVNKDYYVEEFEILFTDAQQAGQVQNSNEVLGKWDKIPVNVRSTAVNGGIPLVTWSLNCDESYATIDAKTGDLTTKRTTSNGKPITITATSVVDESKKTTFDFTIVKVSATSIKTLEEDVAGGTSVVTPNGDNTGVCKVGDSFKLYASSFEPKNATDLDGQIQWSTNDDSVATVDEEGVVTAVGTGTTQISAVYTYGGTQRPAVDYTIKVEKAGNAVTEVVAGNIELNYVGDSKNIGASVLPENATDKTLSYKSSDEKIVTVDEKGQVTAINAGTATVTITAGNGVKKEITVTVKGESKVPVTSSNPQQSNAPAASAAPSGSPVPSVSPSASPAPYGGGDTVAVKAPKVKSVKNVKGKKVRVTIGKSAGAEGYQVAYSTKASFAGQKTVTTKKLTVVLKKLKKKKYYIRVRAYKTVDGTKVYSKYSGKKSVKVKK